MAIIGNIPYFQTPICRWFPIKHRDCPLPSSMTSGPSPAEFLQFPCRTSPLCLTTMPLQTSGPIRLFWCWLLQSSTRCCRKTWRRRRRNRLSCPASAPKSSRFSLSFFSPWQVGCRRCQTRTWTCSSVGAMSIASTSCTKKALSFLRLNNHQCSGWSRLTAQGSMIMRRSGLITFWKMVKRTGACATSIQTLCRKSLNAISSSSRAGNVNRFIISQVGTANCAGPSNNLKFLVLAHVSLVPDSTTGTPLQ